MKKILFVLFGMVAFSLGNLSAQTAKCCANPSPDCKPAECVKTKPECCSTASTVSLETTESAKECTKTASAEKACCAAKKTGASASAEKVAPTSRTVASRKVVAEKREITSADKVKKIDPRKIN